MDDYEGAFQGSTKKILSLIDDLPKTDHIDRHLIAKKREKRSLAKRRFNRHPRILSEESSLSSLENAQMIKSVGKSVEVIKKPVEHLQTDSSDEFCDVTVRKERPYLDEFVLAKSPRKKPSAKTRVVEKQVKEKKAKVESDVSKSIGQDEKEVESEVKVKEEPKIYIDRRLTNVLEKTMSSMGQIRSLIEYGIDPPDGADDFMRRKKRATEFTSRFSRIHLYQLNRQLEDIRGIINGTTASNNIVLNQKFFIANQTVFQGLQSFFKHLPTTIVSAVEDKLKEMLKHACTLCDLYKNNNDKNAQGDRQEDIVDIFEVKCKELIDLLEPKIPKMPKERQAVSLMTLKESQSKKVKRKASKQKRLAMYHSVPIRNDVYWKKAIECMAKRKLNVPSRYKTATYKHRPPPVPVVEKPPEKPSIAIPKPAKRDSEKRSCTTHVKQKQPKTATNLNDIDNVTTLLQSENERKEEECAAVANQSRSTMRQIALGFFNKVSGDKQKMTDGEYECILQHFITMAQSNSNINNNNATSTNENDKLDALRLEKMEQEAQELLENKLGTTLMNMDFNEFAEKFVASVSADNQHQNVPPQQSESSINAEVKTSTASNKSSKKELRQTISVTGAKNAQLICIKDESPVNEPAELNDRSRETSSKHQFKKGKKGRRSQSDNNELVYKERSDEEFALKTKTRLSRVSKQTLKPLSMLPRDTIVKIIEYKLNFGREMRNDFMYQRSGNNSPWNLVERISDKLLEEALQSITRDIQVDEILQKIYSHEFK